MNTVLIVIFAGSAHLASASQPAFDVASTLSAIGCNGVDDYAQERIAVDESFREALEDRFEGVGEIEDTGLGQRIVELLLFLSPAELAELASIIDEHVQALESILPPEMARLYHLQVINAFRLSSNLAREASKSGLVAALALYTAPLIKILDKVAEYAEVAIQTCPVFGELTSLDLPSDETDVSEAVVPTPPSVAGKAELKNVHDAIAARGASVEYGRHTVRIEGITPVGQELIVEGVSVYVFLFGSSEDRVEQTAGLSADAIELETPSGENAAAGELAISEGSNILTVSDGASPAVQTMSDSGIATLP